MQNKFNLFFFYPLPRALTLIAIVACLLSLQARAEDKLDSSLGEKVVVVPSSRDPSVHFETTIFWPTAGVAADAPLVLINHGTKGGSITQERYRPLSPVRFFHQLGWPVVVPNRRAYSNSTGQRVKVRGCDLKTYGLENARDVDDVVDWLLTQEQFKSRKLVVVGQSTGGLTTMAYSSLASNKAVAIINFHGGMHPNSAADCLWDARLDAFSSYAKTSRPTSLWVYTANDHSSNPAYITRLHQIFMAGGGKAELVQLPDFEDDGHYLFGRKNGESIWQPLVRKYLQSMKLLPESDQAGRL